MAVACLNPTSSEKKPSRQIWDSSYGTRSDAFAVFREVICNSFQPWSPEQAGDEGFAGRVEAITYDEGVLGRVQTSPIVALKTPSNIAASDAEYIHGNYVLSGKLVVEQGGRTNVAKAGDLVVYRSSAPIRQTVVGDEAFDNIVFLVPASGLLNEANDSFRNVLLREGRMLAAIESCMWLLNDSFYKASVVELQGILRAIIALLPLAMQEQNRTELKDAGQISLHQILNFIRCHVADQDLSPEMTAEKFSISTRYLHKLFTAQGSGATFRSFVRDERLSRIQCELASMHMKDLPVSGLAFRWGFNELSTFNRAFRAHFGCTPTEFRARLSAVIAG